mmetsp:Transcript_48170/g.133867  ORF Transcript_48170/g.133867 Transcript_48170/m.133867 type:complete len:95 (-) Transcript_48170:2-286(-)
MQRRRKALARPRWHILLLRVRNAATYRLPCESCSASAGTHGLPRRMHRWCPGCLKGTSCDRRVSAQEQSNHVANNELAQTEPVEKDENTPMIEP